MGLTVGNVSPVPNNPTMTAFSSSEYFTIYSPAVPLGALQVGDSVRFWNRTDYKVLNPGGMWNAESTVMVGTDSYYGWGRSKPKSYAGWKETLVKEYNSTVEKYNSTLPWWDWSDVLNPITTAQIQGYDDVPIDIRSNSSVGVFPVYAGFINGPGGTAHFRIPSGVISWLGVGGAVFGEY